MTIQQTLGLRFARCERSMRGVSFKEGGNPSWNLIVDTPHLISVWPSWDLAHIHGYREYEVPQP